MSKYQSVRGTRDLLPELKNRFRYIEDTAFKCAQNYGFKEIETPIFEFSDVFHRSLGETSDAVSKETYTFTDRGGESLTLRPEGTAGVVRAFISEGLAQHNPNKLYYFGPMFRYERPQKGRYRQFYQIGVEVLGIENPLTDVEVLDLAYTFLKKINLHTRAVLEINTLGDQESRDSYRTALLAYLNPLKVQLSEDSQKRLEKNPMRILDSKDENDKKIVLSAPKMEDYLTPAAKDFFTKVIAGLETLKIPFQINPRLVRGLDYYCHTVFEFVTTELGAQGAILAGGRYDGLSETLGGPKTPGVGWASGVDRLSDLTLVAEVAAPSAPIPIVFITSSETALMKAIQLSSGLRNQGKACEVLMTGNLKRKFEKAQKLAAKKAVIIFEQEDGSLELKVKNFETNLEKIASETEILAL